MDPLTEILTTVRALNAKLDAIITDADVKSGKLADDADLDGKYGDPTVKFMPRDWTGEDFAGCHMSEMPAELLDRVAASCDYRAEKAERENTLTSGGKPVAPFNRKDAARARGWAKRIRDGKHTPAPRAAAEAAPEWAVDTSSIPF